MGRAVCAAVSAEADLELVAAVDPSAAGEMLGAVVPGLPASRRTAGTVDAGSLVIYGGVDAIADDAPDVLVDFTRASVCVPALEWCARHGVHAVSGTTGVAGEQIARLRERFTAPGSPNCILASNFAITAVVLLRLVEIAAAHLDAAEIVELHHDAKLDAPSGTALETARRIAAVRDASGMVLRPERTTSELLPGVRGGVAAGGIHVHAIRLPGLVAHEEVVFGALGQSLTIRQDSYDRTSFMPGVLLAVRKVAGLPGLTVGLGDVLGL